MIHPWLLVPPDDYEAHMKLPQVGQLPVLAELIREDLERFQPRSLAVFGCATGNGFEHIEPAVTQRVTGVDINPKYLETLSNRHMRRLPGLRLIESDILALEAPDEPFDLVHAALIFEYVDPAAALEIVTSWIGPSGNLTVILQLPSNSSNPVTSTPYESVRVLSPLLKLVEPDQFEQLARERGLSSVDSRSIALPSGKAFHVTRWRKPGRPEASKT